MESKKKFRAKLIILLGAIWIVITLPLPWIINNPAVSDAQFNTCLLYTSPSPRDKRQSRMPSSA